MAYCIIFSHVLLCILILFFRARVKKRSTNPIMVFVCMIPIAGVILFLMDEYMYRREKIASRDYEMEKLSLKDKRFSSIEGNQDKNHQITVPLEEAMLLNDAKTRRTLMLEILHKNPKEYVDMLKRACMSDDVELTHYATTTIMEIQADYEKLLQKDKQELKKSPCEKKLLERYRMDLEAYIHSGLLSGNIEHIQREELSNVLKQLMEQDAKNKDLLFSYLDNELELGHVSELGEKIRYADKYWHQDERVYMYYVRYYRHSGQGEKIQPLLCQMEKEDIYLSKEGKEWFSFYRRKEPVNEK